MYLQGSDRPGCGDTLPRKRGCGPSLCTIERKSDSRFTRPKKDWCMYLYGFVSHCFLLLRLCFWCFPITIDTFTLSKVEDTTSNNPRTCLCVAWRIYALHHQGYLSTHCAYLQIPTSVIEHIHKSRCAFRILSLLGILLPYFGKDNQIDTEQFRAVRP